MNSVTVIKHMVVNGIEGIAKAVLSDIKLLAENPNIVLSFAVETPTVEDRELDWSDCTGWYGITNVRSARAFFANDDIHYRTALYMDYYGGSWCPQVVVIDMEDSEETAIADIKRALATMLECEEGLSELSLDSMKFFCQLEVYRNE